MLNLTQQTLTRIKNYLLRQKKTVDQQIVSIQEDDPIMSQQYAEASESGTDSWQADVHTRVTMVKNDLGELSKRIAHALTKLNRGTYGKCENCGRQIEAQRLEAMPTATLCMVCSQKPSKKKK